MNNRNLGRFKIKRDFIDEEPERAAEVLSLIKAVPVRAECLFYENVIEYIAISERFTELPEGMYIPEYELRISQDKTGRIELVEVVAAG